MDSGVAIRIVRRHHAAIRMDCGVAIRIARRHHTAIRMDFGVAIRIVRRHETAIRIDFGVAIRIVRRHHHSDSNGLWGCNSNRATLNRCGSNRCEHLVSAWFSEVLIATLRTAKCWDKTFGVIVLCWDSYSLLRHRGRLPQWGGNCTPRYCGPLG